MGIERILYFLDKEQVELAPEPKIELYIGILGKEVKAKAFEFVTNLRKEGIITETDFMDRSVKAQMKYANKIGARFVALLGADELANQKVTLKNMENSEQFEVDFDQFVSHMKKVLNQ